MNKSESIKELAAALAKAKGVMSGAKKDSANPFFKSTYADLSSVVDAIRDAFASNGLSYVQCVEPSDKDEVRVETTLLHSSGEWIACGVLALPVSKHDAQGFGSALTYARRYSLSAAVGVAPEDDDGNAASKCQAPAPQRPATPPPEAIKAKAAQMKADSAAAAKVNKPVREVIEGTATVVAGDPSFPPEAGDLSDVGKPQKPTEEELGKVVHAFANIGYTIEQLEAEYGKRIDEWTVADMGEAREVYKLKAAERKAMLAQMAAEKAAEDTVI